MQIRGRSSVAAPGGRTGTAEMLAQPRKSGHVSKGLAVNPEQSKPREVAFVRQVAPP